MVHPFTTYWWTSVHNAQGFEDHIHTMLPLKCFWAWTIWKAQGLTVKGKVVSQLLN